MHTRVLLLLTVVAIAVTFTAPAHAILDETIISDNTTTVGPGHTAADLGYDDQAQAGVNYFDSTNPPQIDPWRVYTGFDTSGVSAGYTVEQANLKLWVIVIPQTEPTLGAYPSSDHNWDESTLEWPGAAWQEPALDTVTATYGHIGEWLSFDVTQGFERNENLSFVLKAPDEQTDFGSVLFASDEWDVVDQRPRLELQYADDSPELSTIALLALTGLVGAARRRWKS
jgi:hypothetical protein